MRVVDITNDCTLLLRSISALNNAIEKYNFFFIRASAEIWNNVSTLKLGVYHSNEIPLIMVKYQIPQGRKEKEELEFLEKEFLTEIFFQLIFSKRTDDIINNKNGELFHTFADVLNEIKEEKK